MDPETGTVKKRVAQLSLSMRTRNTVRGETFAVSRPGTSFSEAKQWTRFARMDSRGKSPIYSLLPCNSKAKRFTATVFPSATRGSLPPGTNSTQESTTPPAGIWRATCCSIEAPEIRPKAPKTLLPCTSSFKASNLAFTSGVASSVKASLGSRPALRQYRRNPGLSAAAARESGCAVRIFTSAISMQTDTTSLSPHNGTVTA